MLNNFIENRDFSLLLEFAKYKSIKTSTIYIPQSSVFKKMFYIKKGILRSFYITKSGEERTVFFRWEGQMTVIPECVFENEPSRQTWQALEDCELLEIDFEVINKMSKNNFSLLEVRLQFAQKMLIEALLRIESFIINNPEERYNKLIVQKPEIIKRIANKYIASFIGVTPVSLSRIRKRIVSQKK